jgi:hypothetical protein
MSGFQNALQIDTAKIVQSLLQSRREKGLLLDRCRHRRLGRKTFFNSAKFALGRCAVPGSTVAELLRLCPSLTKFEAVWASGHYSDEYCNPAFKEIGTALSKHTSLLTSLKLHDMAPPDERLVQQSSRLR